MGRTPVQTRSRPDLAHAQLLMIETEAIEDLRGTIDDMNTIPIRHALHGDAFCLSHMLRPCFEILVNGVCRVNRISAEAYKRDRYRELGSATQQQPI